jgi:hypothetical protein
MNFPVPGLKTLLEKEYVHSSVGEVAADQSKKMTTV